MKPSLPRFLNLVLLTGALLAQIFVGNAGAGILAPQYFVAFPPGMNSRLATNVFMKCLELVKDVPPDSTLTFLQAIEFCEIASFTAPGQAGEFRLRDEAVVRGMIALRKYVILGSPGEPNFPGQLQLPKLVDEIGARRLPGRHAVLILVGDPRLESVYPAEKSWSMKTGLVPSDGVLRTPYPQTPWGVEGRSSLRGSTVHWLTDRRDWMLSSAHEERVKRFLHLWFKLQGSEGLCSFFGDAERVFKNASLQVAAPVIKAELTPDPSVAMWGDPPPLALGTNAIPTVAAKLLVTQPIPVIRPGPSNIPAIPMRPDMAGALSRNTESLFSGLGSNQLGIAAVWFSEDPKADIDFWVRPRIGTREDDKSEISFSRTNAPGGRLHKDLTSASTTMAVPDFTGASWEAVTLDDPNFDEIAVWLNVFQTAKPVTGQVRALYRGQAIDIPFRFDVVNGDKAATKGHREESPFWLKVDIRGLAPRAVVAGQPEPLAKGP